MGKRLVAGVLWFLAASYGWAFIAAMTGILPSAAVPIGILAATFVVADPMGVLWLRRPRRIAEVSPTPTLAVRNLNP